jgi:hypothetical protein
MESTMECGILFCRSIRSVFFHNKKNKIKERKGRNSSKKLPGDFLNYMMAGESSSEAEKTRLCPTKINYRKT